MGMLHTDIDMDSHSAVASNAELPLSEYLWENSRDILEDARNSTFIAGIRDGTLDPNHYGKYMVQDAVLLREVADVWRELSAKEDAKAKLRDVAKDLHVLYRDESRKLLGAWNIEERESGHCGVLLGSAAEKYMELITSTLKKEEAPYMLIVGYPCLKLWGELAKELAVVSDRNENNLYQFWINKNNTNKYYTPHAIRIDEWDASSSFQLEKALSIFRQAMQCEVDFFNMVEDK